MSRKGRGRVTSNVTPVLLRALHCTFHTREGNNDFRSDFIFLRAHPNQDLTGSDILCLIISGIYAASGLLVKMIEGNRAPHGEFGSIKAV